MRIVVGPPVFADQFVSLHSRSSARRCSSGQQRSSECLKGANKKQVIQVQPKPHFGQSLTIHRRCRGQALLARNHATAATGPVIVVDNYDSFTYNLCQYLGDLGCDFIVLKNDEKTVEQIREMNPLGVLVSPGPGRPEDSGISLEIVEKLGRELPLFGVCMGHQCIGQVFGGNVVRAPTGVMHGKTSLVYHKGTGLLEGLANPFQAARYHSLVIDKETCPEDLEVTAWTEDGTIMAVRHKKFPKLQGVQFHPESIITEDGLRIVKNFVDSL